MGELVSSHLHADTAWIFELLDISVEPCFWSLESSPTMIHLRWISVAVYFSVVLFIPTRLCGIQLVNYFQ